MSDLPGRPRRVTGRVAKRPRKTWQSEGGGAFDPAPTRPVLRAELQGETGAWPIQPGGNWRSAPEDGSDRAEHSGNVVDLSASIRKRAAEGAPAAGVRRVAKPRRIRPDVP